MKKGISVVTPNKKAFSSSLQLWNEIFDNVTPSSLVYHESSVGAGLPVISTIKDLVGTGDQITKIQGVFSGTMSFLFNTFAPASGGSSGKWSEIVAQAKGAMREVIGPESNNSGSFLVGFNGFVVQALGPIAPKLFGCLRASELKVFSVMVISGLSSVFISYSSAWCVRVTSSTTYSMVGALNKLPIALSGIIFFDAPATLGSIGAIFLGFISGIVYAVAKMWQSKGKDAQAKSVLPTTSASVQSMRDSLKN